ncbi:MAG: hypothetical protein Kow0029_00150 [Candidatus Rifleibacteriota bacterium]
MNLDRVLSLLVTLVCLVIFVPVFWVAEVSAQSLPAGVLFVGENQGHSDIYLWQPVLNGESGYITPLTVTSEKEGNARWWNHKEVILASRELSGNRYGIIAIDSNLETIWKYEDPTGSLGWPVPSPWDDRILCVRALGNGFVQPGMITYPDGNFEPFDFNGLQGGQLAWLAPDKIQLSRVTPSGFVITQRELSTGEEKIIVSGGNNWQSFVNLPARQNLFVRRVGQIGSIFRLFQDENQVWDYENVTNARTYDWQPSTSEDGRTLIYRSLRGGRFQTIIRDLETGKEKLLNITGFSKIFFPMIVEPEVVQKLLSSVKK